MGWKPKSRKMLLNIGRRNIAAARRHIEIAEQHIQETQALLGKLKRERPIQPRE